METGPGEYLGEFPGLLDVVEQLACCCVLEDEGKAFGRVAVCIPIYGFLLHINQVN